MAHLCSLQWLLWTPVMTPHPFILAFKPLLSQSCRNLPPWGIWECLCNRNTCTGRHADSLGLSSSVGKIKRYTTGRKNGKEQLVSTGMMSLLSSVAVHTQENGKCKWAPSLGFSWRCGCHDHVVVLLSKLPRVSYEEVHLCSYQTRTYLYLCTEPSPHSVSDVEIYITRLFTNEIVTLVFV